MTKNFKILLAISYSIILFVFLYLIFSNIQISRINDFSYYKEIQFNIEAFIGKNIYINLVYFSIFSIIWVTLLGFGSPLTIISGILFGKWIGTLISLISISVGALILYSITDYFFKDLIKKILKNKFEKYIQIFKKNEFFYFFIYRFAGGLGLPFFLQNTVPVIFRMKKNNYFFASFFGFVPGFFVFNTIGSGLNNFIKQSDNFSMIKLISTAEVYLPIFMFICLILVSIILKKFFFNVRN
tara:strand:+ start:91 stop:813 length:723 start_codon:yes stop_codon:yes gene_type:complete